MPSEIEVGDNVRWYTRKHSGSSIEIKSHQGVVEEIDLSKGTALVRPEFAHRRKTINISTLQFVDKNPFHIFDAAAKAIGVVPNHNQQGLFDDNQND